MKTLIRLGALLAIAAGLALNTARATALAYSSETGALIKFDGAGHFSFQVGGSGSSFKITNDFLGGPGGPAENLLGDIWGTFTIGAITTVGGTSDATVTSSPGAKFVIHDGAFDLTADLDWVGIEQTGGSSALNINGLANLTNIVYGGSNASLLQIAGWPNGVGSSLNFTFTPAVTLAQMKSSVRQTSFSGTLSLPEGGETLMMLGLGLSCLAFLRRKFFA